MLYFIHSRSHLPHLVIVSLGRRFDVPQKKNPHIMFCILLKLSFVAVIVTSQECGVVKYTSELIYGGQTSKKGAWPWLVALHDINTEEFFCGSTLVSDKHILTGKNFFLQFKFISSGHLKFVSNSFFRFFSRALLLEQRSIQTRSRREEHLRRRRQIRSSLFRSERAAKKSR